VRFYIASHARSHGISKTRILEAMSNLDTIQPEAEPGKTAYFGTDASGTRLRMVGRPAAEDPNLIIIMNTMPAEWTKGRKW